MPNAKNYSDKKKFIDACTSEVYKENRKSGMSKEKASKAAYAECISKWKNK